MSSVIFLWHRSKQLSVRVL